LKLVVLMFATLWAITSTFNCCADMPVAAMDSARIANLRQIAILLIS
jgi:hypothetical protein